MEGGHIEKKGKGYGERTVPEGLSSVVNADPRSGIAIGVAVAAKHSFLFDYNNAFPQQLEIDSSVCAGGATANNNDIASDDIVAGVI